YFLFANDNVVDSIAADATFSAQLDNSGGVMIDDDLDLANGTIDRVGWGAGTVTNATEGAKVPNDLTTGDSIERKAWSVSTAERMREPDSRRGNGYETDNNTNDFVIHHDFYAPQNSSSVREKPVRNIEASSRTILFWRSLTEWVGGVGVVVLFLAALIGAGRAARKMYVAEARVERIEPSIRETARTLWKIYALFTLIGVVGLYFAGTPTLFEAVNHSMTGIATGGFTVRNTSFAEYGYPVLAITILIMMAGAISFVVHRRVMTGHWRELFKNIEVQLMLVLIALATLLLIWSVGLRDALFQSSSALTGTGFSTATLSKWGDPQKGLLTVLMVIGGGYGSTSSAIKLIRTVIIVKAVHWMIKRSFLPQRAVVPMKISGRIYSDQEMMETAIYAFIYIIVLVSGAVVLMMVGPYSAMNSVFESASAQGNVGLSVGITSATMPLAGKISMTIQMLVGRLEIIPVIAFISYLISRVPRPRRKPF
ncbi:MAG: TrkH family potassium uptake protein, partial [Hadesarchaea archaeon]|nr:TrkH family potassium uptake protein [Hadesarchaea archaeon]